MPAHRAHSPADADRTRKLYSILSGDMCTVKEKWSRVVGSGVVRTGLIEEWAMQVSGRKSLPGHKSKVGTFLAH